MKLKRLSAEMRKVIQLVCSHPITLEYARGDFQVPCGKCLCCRASKSKEWALRLKHEQAFWDREGFITLTYADEYLPTGGVLVKRDLVNFFKRLRKAISPRKIRYFACGEYGTRTCRPHYHAIVFGIDSRDSDIVAKAWPFGNRISVDPVRSGVSNMLLATFGRRLTLSIRFMLGKVCPFLFSSNLRDWGFVGRLKIALY